MPSASRLFALYLFPPPGKEEESGEKRRGKAAVPAASPVPAGCSGARVEAR